MKGLGHFPMSENAQLLLDYLLPALDIFPQFLELRASPQNPSSAGGRKRPGFEEAAA